MYDFRQSSHILSLGTRTVSTAHCFVQRKQPRYLLDRRSDVSKYRSGPLKGRKEYLPHSETEPRFLGRPTISSHYTDRIMSDSLYYLLILQINPTRCTILLSIFISLLYMFRATMCPSSGEITVSMRHWYLSLCMGGFWSAGWSKTPTSRQKATHTE